MTGPVHYRGQPVSEGTGLGEIYLGDAPSGADLASPGDAPGADRWTEDDVRAAFAAVARDRAALATQLRARGQDLEAGIVDIAALIAGDPALVNPALEAVRAGTQGPDAVRSAAEAQAELLAALPDPDLAQRAGDVRQVAQAVADHLRGVTAAPVPAGAFILVRREVDPADLIRLAEDGLAGAVSVAGGASSHAAIIARGLGLPMLVGADPQVLDAANGHKAILNAVSGELIVDPAAAELEAARAAVRARIPAPASGHDGASPEVKTADGELVTLLCNVASAAETRLGLSGGAAGVGLLRTEISFTGASAWPSEADHLDRLTPILGLLEGRPAVVRLLDFSGDKVPPFLAGRPAQAQGLTALLGEPAALAGQLRAIVLAGRKTRLSVLIPMVRTLDEVAEVRAALAAVSAEAGLDPPELGIMVEVAGTAVAAAAFAPVVDFFSIGTNDLSSEVLGLDRADPATRPALAADPRVLTLIEHVAAVGADAGVKVSVCGDAAADPRVLPLLLGVGIRTLSVGAARVPQVARWISDTGTAAAATHAAQVLGTAVSGQVNGLWRPRPPRARLTSRPGPRPPARRAQLSAESMTPPRPAPRSRDTARAASPTVRISSSRVPGASRRSAEPTTPIAPATTSSLARMGAAIPASPTVASWSSIA
jgi:phosphoenolpyruvate-protein kinase (PTS system EI component)